MSFKQLFLKSVEELWFGNGPEVGEESNDWLNRLNIQRLSREDAGWIGIQLDMDGIDVDEAMAKVAVLARETTLWLKERGRA